MSRWRRRTGQLGGRGAAESIVRTAGHRSDDAVVARTSPKWSMPGHRRDLTTGLSKAGSKARDPRPLDDLDSSHYRGGAASRRAGDWPSVAADARISPECPSGYNAADRGRRAGAARSIGHDPIPGSSPLSAGVDRWHRGIHDARRVRATARRDRTTTEGPFYPDKLPLDTDNDLIIINDAITPAVGEITHLAGASSPRPASRSATRSWRSGRSTTTGRTCTPAADSRPGQDANFQGYGRFLTDAKGQYYFRTIKPIDTRYTDRTPHIHFAISRNGRRMFTTQLFIKGHPRTTATSSFARRDPPRSRRCSSSSSR